MGMTTETGLTTEVKTAENGAQAVQTNEMTPELAKLVADVTEPMLRFFQYRHLPEALQAISKPFGDLAQHVVDTIPRCAERTVVLRKLLEGKDAAVRAALP